MKGTTPVQKLQVKCLECDNKENWETIENLPQDRDQSEQDSAMTARQFR
jgi:hypothetical protein